MAYTHFQNLSVKGALAYGARNAETIIWDATGNTLGTAATGRLLSTDTTNN